MKKSILLFMTILVGILTYAQTVHTVDNRSQSGAQFQDIQTAIDAASAGDIIHIHPSPINYSTATINKQLKLVGLGHDPITNNQGLTAKIPYINFTGNSANSTITGLTILNYISKTGTINHIENIHIIHNKIYGITITLSNGLANSWVIEGNYITSSSYGVASTSTNDGWIIKNNFMLGGISGLNVTNLVVNNIFFSDSNSVSDTFFSSCNATIISNNIFVTNANMTEFAQPNCINLDFRNNLTYSYVGNTIATLPGTGNLDNTNPMFVIVPTNNEDDFYNNDYHLNTGSSGINYGTDGTNIGIYGNNFLFDLHGRPDMMSYPISININNSVVAPGQNLNVNFSAAQKQ